MGIRLQLESALAENRELRFALQHQALLAMSAALPNGEAGSVPAVPVFPSALLMDPAAAFFLSNAAMAGTALQLGQTDKGKIQEMLQGYIRQNQLLELQGNNMTQEQVAALLLLANQRTDARAPANVEESTDSNTSLQGG